MAYATPIVILLIFGVFGYSLWEKRTARRLEIKSRRRRDANIAAEQAWHERFERRQPPQSDDEPE
ncbi:hypothetical protein [Sphingomonas sp.]|uniref:hypothetical protein n=1 Tax=Sphingomonas sp. TaxID=28214 RepID=UPI001B163F78|nr:hypothetical protein [Sphingomonas sp.]MBO9713749.1 hypothetical protein [Sphingomonas sp.]